MTTGTEHLETAVPNRRDAAYWLGVAHTDWRGCHRFAWPVVCSNPCAHRLRGTIRQPHPIAIAFLILNIGYFGLFRGRRTTSFICRRLQ